MVRDKDRVWEGDETMSFHIDAAEFGKGCACVFEERFVVAVKQGVYEAVWVEVGVAIGNEEGTGDQAEGLCKVGLEAGFGGCNFQFDCGDDVGF